MKQLIFLFSLIFVSVYARAADIEIAAMLMDYEKNQARFYSKYQNKKIEKSGIVYSIIAETALERSINSITQLPPMFLISLNVSGSKVSCFTSDEKIAVSLNTGVPVFFSGVITDINVTGDGIQVNKCKIFLKKNS